MIRNQYKPRQTPIKLRLLTSIFPQKNPKKRRNNNFKQESQLEKQKPQFPKRNQRFTGFRIGIWRMI